MCFPTSCDTLLTFNLRQEFQYRPKIDNHFTYSIFDQFC